MMVETMRRADVLLHAVWGLHGFAAHFAATPCSDRSAE
jgi:hypothetical protein